MIAAELNQQCLRGGQRLPRAVLERVLKLVSKEMGIRSKKEVSIAFVNKRTMRKLNRTYRGNDCVTDVLSFGINDDHMLGELILCYEQAKKQAKEVGYSTRDEVVFLLVHGLLHLLGLDHEKPKDAKKMFLLQQRILLKLNVDPKL